MKIRTAADTAYEERTEQFLLTLPNVVFAAARWDPEEGVLSISLGLPRKFLLKHGKFTVANLMVAQIGNKLTGFHLTVLGGSTKEDLQRALESHQQAQVS